MVTGLQVRGRAGCWSGMLGVGKLLSHLRGDASLVEECKILLGTRVDFEGCVALFVCAMAFVSMDQIVLNT